MSSTSNTRNTQMTILFNIHHKFRAFSNANTSTHLITDEIVRSYVRSFFFVKISFRIPIITPVNKPTSQLVVILGLITTINHLP